MTYLMMVISVVKKVVVVMIMVVIVVVMVEVMVVVVEEFMMMILKLNLIDEIYIYCFFPLMARILQVVLVGGKQNENEGEIGGGLK